MKDSETQENAAPGGTCAADCSIPAFPGQWYETDSTGETRVRYNNEGMTLRDWFASQVLASLVGVYGFEDGEDKRMLAERAYEMADAMLTARESNATLQGSTEAQRKEIP